MFEDEPPVKITRTDTGWYRARISRKIYYATRHGDIQEWVENTYGAHKKGWKNPRWSRINTVEWDFRDEKDAMFFKLRWE